MKKQETTSEIVDPYLIALIAFLLVLGLDWFKTYCSC